MTRRKTRAGLYARVSTDKQDLGVQLPILTDFAELRGWQVYQVYTDVITGATASRPGLDALIADANAGKLDVVVVQRIDRLGRGGLVQLVLLVDELISMGVQVADVSNPNMDTTTPTGRLLFGIFTVLAEYERTLISERTKAGVEHARAMGKQIGRRYADIDMERVHALREEGKSLRKVSELLGIPKSTLHRRLQEESAAE